eukprot:TRINITY_DN3781_c0_g1_i1.p1 TRINITY_DN3781_c0_g1~~TRINITY_DN3781_c0_g1_i1.p1  ORF type:complete len:208 (+),score=16.96 TRINITY_DN3781_c0_g1_i1:179-802(+)
MANYNYEYIFKLIVIGDMGVGKSCILYQFTDNKFVEDCPHTIGVEFGTRIIEVQGKKVKLQMWDTAGQERFRAVTRSYYRGAAGALLVFDVARRSTFHHLTAWLKDVQALTSPNTVILLVGNKSDLDTQRDVSFDEASKFAKANGLLYMETSAMTGKNVESVFQTVAEHIYTHIQNGSLDPNAADTGVLPKVTSYNSNKKETKGGCC